MPDLFKEAADGAAAARLLNDPIYMQALSSVREGIRTKWEQCPIRDTEGQHQLKLMLKLLNDLEANIREVATTGKLASIQIENDTKTEEKKSRLADYFNRWT